MKTYEDYEDYCSLEHQLAACPKRAFLREIKYDRPCKHYELQRSKERETMLLGHNDVIFPAQY